MKHKIAILTQPLGWNYGGIIQNYALQKVLKDLGYNSITIDRRNNSKLSKLERKWLDFKVEVYYKINNINGLADTYYNIQRVSKYTNHFIKKYINKSESITSDHKLNQYFGKNQFKAIIVGSDQTWRPKYSPNIYQYYLEFLKDGATKRIAYASSFGTDEWEYTKEETIKCQQLAQKFDAISVRENSGINLCEKFLNVKAQHVLDPTLLLSKNDYDFLIKDNLSKNNKQKGLYTYVLDEGKNNDEIIQFCLKKLQLKQFKNQSQKSIYKADSNNIEEYRKPPIENWLRGFRDANFVITDSFHGTIFSIIYNKPFIAITNLNRGASRFISLLSALGLENRLINNLGEVTNDLLHKPIDYNTVDEKLNVLRETSIKFLKDNLQ